ncbi:MAG TPA: 4-(cytidine 5'-diphospho)-2-C-methyl-D-erythritol kinase [Rhizomicrobium sp.]|jgi:4-diphosphocytidyl-2-C-methyl-D-erythritol kinase|nr:4-(cytidine 5'-diphospho)-2-C-methyl-D-erythritol kinase [Rhizomicrobium sp.]
MIRELAPAKINLFLHAGNRRADGYHDIESLVVFASVGDELTFEEADELSLNIEGPFASTLAQGPDNLVLRAARRFGEQAQIEPRVQITLTKNVPVASGIGGGSSDAAATFRGLSRMWPGRTNLQALWDIGGDIGSDVPVSVLPGCWWMTGRGERFANVGELGTFDALLVNAGVPVSTAAIYDALRERTGVGRIARPQRFRTISELAEYLASARNDLEPPARALAPVIGEQLEALTGTRALLARMSGSGATCFGIYPDAVSAQAAAHTIAEQHPNWWLAPTRLNYGREWTFQ